MKEITVLESFIVSGSGSCRCVSYDAQGNVVLTIAAVTVFDCFGKCSAQDLLGMFYDPRGRYVNPETGRPDKKGCCDIL